MIPTVYAHEAYVLTPQQFHQGLQVYSPNPLGGLLDSSHIGITVLITAVVMLTYFFCLIFSTTKLASRLDSLIKKLGVVGPLLIRLAISSSFIFGAIQHVILGPELPLATVPYGALINEVMLILGVLVLIGLFTEVAAAVALVIFFYIASSDGWYLLTYANYFGELLVLMLFGSRFLSFDRIIFGTHTLFKSLQKYRFLEIPIVRILYGIALIYAGWTIKFEHQQLSVLVYNEYHLRNFFHASASFIASGAGVSEILIGLFIMIGFEVRLTVFVSLVFITLSILYFREIVWPHFLLYGISLSLLINSADKLSVQTRLVPWVRKLLKREKLFEVIHL